MSDDLPEQIARARAQDAPPAVEAELPSAADRERLLYVIESLVGSLDYDGVKRWLEAHPTLDEAWAEAQRLRGGMVAT